MDMLEYEKLAEECQSSAQGSLKEYADAQHPMAQYLLGKLIRDSDVPGLYKHGTKTKIYRTAFALAGNAYAMVGLALEHEDAGYISTLLWWWKEAILQAHLPEASFNIVRLQSHTPEASLSVGSGEGTCVFDFKEAAKWFGYTIIGIDVFKYREEISTTLLDWLLNLGPDGVSKWNIRIC